MNDISENKFWLCVWALVVFTLCVIIVIGVSYNMDKNKLIAQSDNPLETACAISDNDSKPCMAYMGSLK